jgi:nucleolar complex protein 2
MAKKHRPKGEKKRGLSAPHAHAKKRASSEEDAVGGTRGIKDVKDMDLDDLLGIEVSDGPSPGDLSEGSSSSEDDLELTREDMEKLKETDPEFYSYLKSTDEGLLDFNVDEDEDEEEKKEEEEEEEEENDEEQEEEEPKAASVVITSESLKSWCAAAQKTASLGAVKQMTRLYRIACHYGDEEAGEESLQLASSGVYNNILLFMLGKADDIFRKALVIDSDDVDVTKQPRWPKYESLIRSYLGNTLHLLGMLLLLAWEWLQSNPWAFYYKYWGVVESPNRILSHW